MSSRRSLDLARDERPMSGRTLFCQKRVGSNGMFGPTRSAGVWSCTTPGNRSVLGKMTLRRGSFTLPCRRSRRSRRVGPRPVTGTLYLWQVAPREIRFRGHSYRLPEPGPVGSVPRGPSTRTARHGGRQLSEVAPGRLELDHVRAEVPEDLCAERTRDYAREVQDPDPPARARRSVNRFLLHRPIVG